MAQEASVDAALRSLVAFAREVNLAGDGDAQSQGSALHTTKPADDQVAKMRAMRSTIAEPSPPAYSAQQRKSIFSDVQKRQVKDLQKQVDQERARQALERELAARRAREEQQRRQALIDRLRAEFSRHSGKTFASNQEARRFFMSLLTGLPDDLVTPLLQRGMQWRCNAYDCVHSAPHECADPSQGGVWLIP